MPAIYRSGIKLTARLCRVALRALAFTCALAALPIARRLPKFGKKRIWLFGGSSGWKFADNAAALFRFARENYPEIDARWIIDSRSPDYSKARAHGEVLSPYAVTTFLHGLLAEVHVVSHGTQDVPTCASRFAKAFKVRLGHGITALVKRARRLDWRGMPAPDPLTRVFDLVPVSSEFEARVKETWGFAPNRIEVTGMARYDELLACASSRRKAVDPRRILFMPTARDALVGRPDLFDQSLYRYSIVRFLDGVDQALDSYNCRMYFYVHPLMKDLFERMEDAFSRRAVDLLEVHADLQEVLVDSSLLITDYSSVAWDALYIERPVLFFQFDHEEYFRCRGQGSYLDLESELFGIRVIAPDSAVEAVRELLESDFHCLGADRKVRSWRERAFVSIDQDNRQRIMSAISRRLARPLSTAAP